MAVRDPNYGLKDWVSGGSSVWDSEIAGPILLKDYFTPESSSATVITNRGAIAYTSYTLSRTITANGAITAGNSLILFIGTTAGTADDITAVTDSTGNTWIKDHSSRAGGRTGDFWRVQSAVAGTPVITVTTASYVTSGLTLYEVSGLDASPLDAVQNAGDAGTTVHTASVSNSTTNGIIFGAYSGDQPLATYSTGGGYGNLQTASPGDYFGSASIAKTVTAAGVNSPSLTSSIAGAGNFIAIAYKTGGGATVDPETVPYNDYGRVYSVYLGWLNRYMRTDGAIVRPMLEGNGDTTNSYAPAIDVVSEGTAYAQIYAVQLDDKATFDKVEAFNYSKMDRRNYVNGAVGSNAPTNGFNLMMYHFNPTNDTAFDWAAAYDADIDRSKALLWAHARWGSSGTINYLSRALAILGDLVTYGLRQSSANNMWYMVSGSGNMSISEPEMNNSYLDPAAFRLFAQYDTTNAAKWLSAVDSSYDIIQKTANAVLPNPAAPGNTQTTTAKLPANWVTMNFTTGVVTPLTASYRDTNYTYDAFRQTNRLLYDYEYYGEARALARLQDYKSFFTTQWNTYGRIEAEYFHDGSIKSAYEQRMFYYAAWQVLTVNDPTNSVGAAIWAAKIAPNFYEYQSYNSFYDNSVDNTNNVSYYGQSWLLFDELDRTGLYRNYGQAKSKAHTTDVFKYRARTHSTDVYKTVGTVVTDYTYATAASADDATETISTGAVDITIQQPVVSGLYHNGFRFPNITIPKNETIAYAKFQQANYASASSDSTAGFAGVTVKGEASDNAAQFTTATSNISSRAVTTATGENADPLANNKWGASANNTQGIDVTTIVQETLNRAGWASGNAMALLLKGSGTATDSITLYAWDYFSGNQTNRLLIGRSVASARAMARRHSTDTFRRTGTNPNYTKTHTTSVLKRKTVTGGTSVNTYYFDGHTSITDPGNVWTNDVNAFDSSQSTIAGVDVLGSVSSNYLLGRGTNAPGTGGTISQVRARIRVTGDGMSEPEDNYRTAIYTDGKAELLGTAISGNGSGGPLVWSSYATLSTPSGGWTWAKIQALESYSWLNDGTFANMELAQIEIEVTSNAPFAHTTDTFKRYNKNYSRENLVTLPTTTTDLANAFDATAYDNVATDNEVYVDQTGANTEVFQFKYTAQTNTSPITLNWNGKSSIPTTTKTAYLQIWNNNTSAWETLTSNNNTAANTDFTMAATKSTSVANYYDATNTVIARVYQ